MRRGLVSISLAPVLACTQPAEARLRRPTDGNYWLASTGMGTLDEPEPPPSTPIA